jgi:MYXO-CTERM domain-containing protein
LVAVSLSTVSAAGPASAHHARGSTNVFWFMHVSDLHIGSEWYPDHLAHATFALNDAVHVIHPWFLVATGDLCDGSKGGIPTTGQDQSEWDSYKSLYTGAGLLPDFYFDLPGNHDGYGDVGMSFYLANSLQGSTTGSLFQAWTVEIPMGEYLFFGMNSAGDGSGPFLEDPEFTADEIAALEDMMQSHASAQLVFLAAHHPLSDPKNGSQVQSLLEGTGGYYLHGHVHAYEEYLADSIVVNEVDSLGKASENNIAVGAVDHNGFVYRATGTSEPWPFVVVTAPMATELRGGGDHPYDYAVCKDRADNPVRALVFTDGAPTDVIAQIGSAPAATMTPVGSPSGLWEAEVDTTGLTAGVHDVTVTATVGGETAFHKIRTEFVDGPCDPLPVDPPPVADGGVPEDAGDAGGEADAGAEAEPDGSAGSGGGGTGGSGGTAGGATGGTSGGALDSGAAGDAGQDVDELFADPTTSEDGGCGCRAARGTSTGSLVWLGIAGLAMVFARRAKQRA